MGAAQPAAGPDWPVEWKRNDVDLAFAQFLDHAAVVGIEDDPPRL